MLIYFTVLESFFYRLSRLVRAWPASQARASFSLVKACFCVNTAGQLFVFSIVTGLVLVARCHFFVTARCSLKAFARKFLLVF